MQICNQFKLNAKQIRAPEKINILTELSFSQNIDLILYKNGLSRSMLFVNMDRVYS